jgi:hypothetical protein
MSKKRFKTDMDKILSGPFDNEDSELDPSYLNSPEYNAKLQERAAELAAQAPAKKRGRPVTITKTVTKESERGTKPGETRATFIVNEELLTEVKFIAHWDRISIKDFVNEALEKAAGMWFLEKRNEPTEDAIINKALEDWRLKNGL